MFRATPHRPATTNERNGCKGGLKLPPAGEDKTDEMRRPDERSPPRELKKQDEMHMMTQRFAPRELKTKMRSD